MSTELAVRSNKVAKQNRILAISDQKDIKAAADDWSFTLCALTFLGLTALATVGFSAGPAYGLQFVHTTVFGHVAAVLGIGIGFTVIVGMIMGASNFFGIHKALRARKMKQLVSGVPWRPRNGATHPKGREDTYDRFVIEKKPHDEGVEVSLVRFSYGSGVWKAVETIKYPELFTPAKETEMDDYITELRDYVVERERAAIEAHAEAAARTEAIKAMHENMTGAEIVF